MPCMLNFKFVSTFLASSLMRGNYKWGHTFMEVCLSMHASRGVRVLEVAGRPGGGDAASCLQHGMVGNLRTEEEEEWEI